MQPPAAASVRADRMWFRRSLRVSMVPKYLFIPLPDEISEFWARCCDLTLVGRSIVEMNRQKKNVSGVLPSLEDGRSYCGGGDGGERVKLTDGLRVRIMAHDEPIRFEANTLVVPAHNKKQQLEFDSIVFASKERATIIGRRMLTTT